MRWRSPEDFAHVFSGVEPGSMVTRTHTFKDVVKALHGAVERDGRRCRSGALTVQAP